MRRYSVIAISVIVLMLIIFGLYHSRSSVFNFATREINTVRSEHNPAGTLVVEVRSGAVVPLDAAQNANESVSGASALADAESWPSYNRTLTSQRFSPLSQINTQTVQGLKVTCTYDTGLHENFNTGPIVIDGALIFTTGLDTFSIGAADCRENWRTHEDPVPHAFLLANRGVAYLDGRLFRGTLDGRVFSYDSKTGKRLWATTVTRGRSGEWVVAAPIAWNGLVFIGIVVGDIKGVKGRMYALDAATGRIVWESYTVPKQEGDPTLGPQGTMPTSITTWENPPDVPISGGGTWTSYTLDPTTGRLYIPVGNASPDFVIGLRQGDDLFTNSVVVLDAMTGNYISHFKAVSRDWHDWDVSNTPSLITTKSGKQLMSFTPKNGYLYGVELASNKLVYRSQVTRVENPDAPLSTEKPTHFCPGALGGGEWNGVAYDPETNLIYSGESEWCTTVTLAADAKVKATKNGELWFGVVLKNPLDFSGVQDPYANWAGWLYATDADSGEWTWRAKSNYPILSGVTPTAGGIVFFGDYGGNVYALAASNGQRLWSKELDGAVGGGVISYAVHGAQKVAVATGLNSFQWPTKQGTAKIVILGL